MRSVSSTSVLFVGFASSSSSSSSSREREREMNVSGNDDIISHLVARRDPFESICRQRLTFPNVSVALKLLSAKSALYASRITGHSRARRLIGGVVVSQVVAPKNMGHHLAAAVFFRWRSSEAGSEASLAARGSRNNNNSSLLTKTIIIARQWILVGCANR